MLLWQSQCSKTIYYRFYRLKSLSYLAQCLISWWALEWHGKCRAPFSKFRGFSQFIGGSLSSLSCFSCCIEKLLEPSSWALRLLSTEEFSDSNQAWKLLLLLDDVLISPCKPSTKIRFKKNCNPFVNPSPIKRSPRGPGKLFEGANLQIVLEATSTQSWTHWRPFAVGPPWSRKPNGASTTSLFGYGSIPINTILSGMNIHLPAILMFKHPWQRMFPLKPLLFRL